MLARRLLAFVAFLLVCLAATAANVEQRSPFRQGHWWDPTRSGHGFELLNAGGQVMVVWYTYDAAGSPTWYTAQGTQESLGDGWNLQRHEWADGRIARSTNVGTMRLTVRHNESISALWNVDGAQGTWALEPFVASGTINEVDLTGHWYDPGNSGWGMTLLDQGDVFGAVIYAYDASGAPTWVAGFDRGKGTRVDLFRTRGTCPWCTYQAPATAPAGHIDIAYMGDTQVTVRGAPSIALADGVRIDGARAFQLGRPASTRRVDYQLATFATEQTLKQYIGAGMFNRVFSSSGTDFSPAPPSASSTPVSFSSTNVQEADVDEADVMKSDGRHVYALEPGTWIFTPATSTTPSQYVYGRRVRVAYVGEGGGQTIEPRTSFPLNAGSFSAGEAALYLHAGNLVTLATGYYYGGWYYSPSVTSETTVEILDVSNPAAPASRWVGRISGTMVSSRRIGDRLYLVTRFSPSVPGLAYGQDAANRRVMDATPLRSILPSIVVNGAAPVPLVGLDSIYAPQLAGSRAVADMVVVTVIDIRTGALMQGLAILGRTDAMYMSSKNLYLASSRYETHPLASSVPRPLQASLLNSDIHQIAVTDGGVRLVGTGSIEGGVGYGDKAAFRFGEHNGRLGVVTSTMTGWWGDTSNRVTILEPSAKAAGMLKTVSYLPNSRRPQALGKPHEMLYGTRFVGDRLYAVTFKKTDPLYTVDLSNPADPRISGELEIPGFSDYLHPLPNGLLLGFGKDAVPADSQGDAQWAWFQGLQLTLFDVSGASPREMQRVLIGKRGSYSALLASHHAFSALTRADGSTVIAFPAQVHDGVPQYGYSGPTTYYPWQYSGLLHFEVKGTTPADARIEQGRTLVSARPTTNAPYESWEEYGAPGRSVLFPEASIYTAGGKFWRQDSAGNTSGPY
jgi:uncharacterized secreted protein with C-terminal beta-propeller domain